MEEMDGLAGLVRAVEGELDKNMVELIDVARMSLDPRVVSAIAKLDATTVFLVLLHKKGGQRDVRVTHKAVVERVSK